MYWIPQFGVPTLKFTYVSLIDCLGLLRVHLSVNCVIRIPLSSLLLFASFFWRLVPNKINTPCPKIAKGLVYFTLGYLHTFFFVSALLNQQRKGSEQQDEKWRNYFLWRAGSTDQLICYPQSYYDEQRAQTAFHGQMETGIPIVFDSPFSQA